MITKEDSWAVARKDDQEIISTHNTENSAIDECRELNIILLEQERTPKYEVKRIGSQPKRSLGAKQESGLVRDPLHVEGLK